MKKVVITTITGIDIELTANDDSAVTFLTQFANHNSRAGIRATDEHGILAPSACTTQNKRALSDVRYGRTQYVANVELPVQR